MGERRERKKKVKAARLFRPSGLVPPGIAEHSVKILHFKINHSRLSTRRKTHTLTRMCHTCTQTNVHSHNMLEAMSSVLLLSSLSVSQQLVMVGC